MLLESRKMTINIRKFSIEDIPNKVEWINNPKNNKYLHYNLPLEVQKTINWFKNNEKRTDRFDAIIEVDGIPVGLIGLLGIDRNNSKAEYYISMGNTSFKGKGVATEASRLILDYAFRDLRLNNIYLFTEVDNVIAQRLFEKVGFIKEGLLKKDIYYKGHFVDRYAYAINRNDFYRLKINTPIQLMNKENNNNLFIKREDLIPYSFGGNKARKALLFFKEIDKGDFDCVVTYGSSHSNHCRVVANMAAARNMDCVIIGPEEVSDVTYNSKFMELFGAEIITVPVEQVHDTIEHKLAELKAAGKNPYFITGGGHGNIGTQAYVECYEEIRYFEEKNNLHFDYIFFASGTGTTHAGLVCGQIINNDDRYIIGISIARKNPRGRDVVIDSIKEYMPDIDNKIIEAKTIFIDKYIGSGYGKENDEIIATIKEVMINYGIPLDTTYTGKAFNGMKKYIIENNIQGKNILFIHTGGTPLFFDDLGSF